MAKIIWKELKENDPIFKTGFIISNPKVNFNKKEKEISYDSHSVILNTS